MTANQEAAILRARARSLRRLAADLERTPAMELERFAGVTTWRSPRADACDEQLLADQAGMLHAADDLRWAALRLEQRAVELEVEAGRQRLLDAS